MNFLFPPDKFVLSKKFASRNESKDRKNLSRLLEKNFYIVIIIGEYVHVCMCVCVYIYYIYSYVLHIHTHTHTHIYICVAQLLQLCPTLCDPMDYSLPGFSVHGILQARILEWVAIPISRRSFRPRDWTHVSYVSCNAGGFFTICACNFAKYSPVAFHKFYAAAL